MLMLWNIYKFFSLISLTDIYLNFMLFYIIKYNNDNFKPWADLKYQEREKLFQ